MEADALSSRNTGCQSISAALRKARAATRRRSVKHQDLGAGIPQNFDLAVDRIVGKIESEIGNDHLGPIAEPFLQPPEQILPELIVLPEHRDIPLR